MRRAESRVFRAEEAGASFPCGTTPCAQSSSAQLTSHRVRRYDLAPLAGSGVWVARIWRFLGAGTGYRRGQSGEGILFGAESSLARRWCARERALTASLSADAPARTPSPSFPADIQ